MVICYIQFYSPFIFFLFTISLLQCIILRSILTFGTLASMGNIWSFNIWRFNIWGFKAVDEQSIIDTEESNSRLQNGTDTNLSSASSLDHEGMRNARVLISY